MSAEDMFSKRAMLTDLPILVVEKIFRPFSYEELSNLRITCKFIQRSAERMLNDGFFQFGRQVSHASATLKRQLPKKESERRAHPLNRYCDVFSALETRYTLLTMTYRKFIDQKLCCFIPGKVLDIGFAVMAQVNSHLAAGRPANSVVDVIGILKDIRDYSSMAMEHFDEHVAPRLPARPFLSALRPILNPSQPLVELYGDRASSSTNHFARFDVGSPIPGNNGNCQCAEVRAEMRNKFDELNRIIDEQSEFIRQIVGFLGDMGEQNEWTPRLMNNLRRMSSNYGRVSAGGDAPSKSANAISTAEPTSSKNADEEAPKAPKLRRKKATANHSTVDKTPVAMLDENLTTTSGRKILRARRRNQ